MMSLHPPSSLKHRWKSLKIKLEDLVHVVRVLAKPSNLDGKMWMHLQAISCLDFTNLTPTIWPQR